jgi:SAM-dependent methyltransferase
MSAVSPDRILEVGLGFWASKTLLSAVEMGVFSELAKQPDELAAVAQRLQLHPRSAGDFLDALVALGFLERHNGVYRNTPATAAFLDRNKPSYIGGILEMANDRLYGFWNHLTEGLRTGQMQNEAKNGDDFFAALYAEPARLREFLRAMSGLSRGANLRIAELIPWKNYKTLVDVGTAQGDTVVQIAKAHPHLRGIGFDLPKVQPTFEEYVAEHGLSPRVNFVPGDFFKDPIPPADVVIMGHILHDWDLEQKRTLIRKAYDALPPGGTLIAYDGIIDDDRKTNAFGLLMSLNMLIETPGGFDYTGADCQRWMKEAGFRQTRVQHLVGPDSMVIAVK